MPNCIEGATYDPWKSVGETTTAHNYREGNLPLYAQWRQRKCHTDPRSMHPLMHKVIQGVKENDLHQCVKDIVTARVRRRDEERPVVLDPNHFLSTYR